MVLLHALELEKREKTSAREGSMSRLIDTRKCVRGRTADSSMRWHCNNRQTSFQQNAQQDIIRNGAHSR